MTTKLEPVDPLSGRAEPEPGADRARLATILEVLVVIAAPAVLYVVLSLRGMAPGRLPDPSMHSTFIFDPHAIFTRYQAIFTPTSRLREAARVGFLVPARLSYLIFGAVPGFFVFRYVLALVAIVPAYLLMRRLYGRWAGFLAIAVIMSSPVVITAWGTDYPDSAAVSYLTGALPALAMTLLPERRRRGGWLIAAAGLLTLAVWAHGSSVPLVAAFGVSYLGLRLVQDRAGLGRDVVLMAVTALATTAVLAVASKLLIGQFNFISPTLRAARFLSTPAQEKIWHSRAWTWAPYDPYLLLLPAVVLAFWIAVAGRLRGDRARLFIGLAGTLAVLTAAYLQFLGSVQTLEMHYLSSPLWSAVNLMFVMALAEVSRPLLLRGARTSGARWLGAAVPALLVIAIAFAYAHARPHLPAMTWGDAAFVFGLVIVAGAVVGRGAIVEAEHRRQARGTVRRPLGIWLMSAAAVVVMAEAALILTVVPGRSHPRFPNTAKDPPPAYAGALGGSPTRYIDQYRVTSELPGFVGPPAYRGELLMMWWPKSETPSLEGPIGIYHASFNVLSWTFPRLNDVALAKLRSRHPAQMLLLGLTTQGFAQAVQSLAPYEPALVRRGELRDGGYRLHLWLLDLRRYLKT